MSSPWVSVGGQGADFACCCAILVLDVAAIDDRDGVAAHSPVCVVAERKSGEMTALQGVRGLQKMAVGLWSERILVAKRLCKAGSAKECPKTTAMGRGCWCS